MAQTPQAFGAAIAHLFAMSNASVITALIEKRSEITAYILDLEKKVIRMRARLAHIDNIVLMFTPDEDPDSIPAKRLYRRTMYFQRNELQRHCLDMIRVAEAPIAANEIARQAMESRGLEASRQSTERVLSILRRLHKRGVLVRIGAAKHVRWAMAKDDGASQLDSEVS